MLKTFNAGVGMVVVVAADAVDDATNALKEQGQTVIPLGKITSGQGVTYSGALW